MIRKFAYLAAFCAGPAVAQDVALDCTSDELSTHDLSHCVSASYERSDEEMLYYYARAIRSYQEFDKNGWAPRNPSAEEQLHAAQRAWAEYRDAECASENVWYYGGNLQGTLEVKCLERLTTARIEALKSIARDN